MSIAPGIIRVRFKTGCFVFGEKLTRIYAIADVRVI
jgi:hypothetical protein